MKKCLNCKKPFKENQFYQRYCALKCRVAGWRDRQKEKERERERVKGKANKVAVSPTEGNGRFVLPAPGTPTKESQG